MITSTGAPQWHNQRSFAPSISDYMKYSSDTKLSENREITSNISKKIEEYFNKIENK